MTGRRLISAFSLLAFALCYKLVPETKGRSVAEIEADRLEMAVGNGLEE